MLIMTIMTSDRFHDISDLIGLKVVRAFWGFTGAECAFRSGSVSRHEEALLTIMICILAVSAGVVL